MKKFFATVMMTGLLAGAASAEWDFDVHGAQIAQPRAALGQAQRAVFLGALETELSEPVSAWDTTETAVEFAVKGFQSAAEATSLEAASR